MPATDADDVFQECAPVIVDCDVLEAAKENVQPLASGRRVTALSAILQTPHGVREAKLAATRNRLRINVEIALDDEDDDPLEAYCRLVYWTVENYPQGHSAESGLLDLLEEATRALKDDRGGKWRGELKYLKLWVLYATFVEKPVVIYKFLIANEIGTGLALLYEEYAAVLERDGRRTDADAVFMLGIARKASPLDHLKGRHQEFQKRMMSSPSLPAASAPEAVSSSSRRTILGTTMLSSTSAPTLPTSTRSLPSHNGVVTAAAPLVSNTGFPVFVDPSGSEDRSRDPPTNPWPELGTRKTRIQQNIPEVKKMVGTTIKQPGRSKRIASGTVSGSAAASKIIPYRDGSEEVNIHPPTEVVPKTPAKNISVFSEAVVPSTPTFTPFRDEPITPGVNIPASTSAASIPDSVMRVKVAAKSGPVIASEAEALRKDPLKNYGNIAHADI